MSELKKSLGGVQFFTIGFGAIVGVGWIVYMGLWYEQAGPVGTMIAFLAGGLLMALIALCYAELATMYPVAGAEAAYAYGAFGGAVAFVVGWALVLMLIAVIPYVSVSLAWILDVLIPGMAGPVLYTWRGQPVRATSLAIAVFWTLWLGVVNYRGIKGASRFQDLLTFGKIAVSLLFFAAGIFGGRVEHLEPIFPRPLGAGALGGIVAVLSTTPWFFGGFNQIPQVLEEKSSGTSVRSVGLIVVLSVLAAAVYYALAALSAGMAAPWPSIARQELPVAAAFRAAFGSELLARAVLVAGLFGIVTVGNACTIAATRLLFALSRARAITPVFQRLHAEYGSPVPAIAFVTGFGVLGNFLGRSGIAPIVNVGSVAAALGYLITALAVLRLRRTAPDRPRPYRMPLVRLVGGISAAGALFLLASSLRQHWIDAKGGVPIEWVVIVVWAAIGFALYRAAGPSRRALGESQLRRLVLGLESSPHEETR